MQGKRMSQIGVLIIVVGAVFVFPWWYSIGYFFNDSYSSGRIPALTFAALNAGPPAALVLVGFIMYITGRGSLWVAANRPKALLVVVGLVLMAAGGFFATWFWAFSAYAANKLGPPYARPISYYLATSSPYFVLFALWILSGLLIFADAVEAMFAARRTPGSG